METSDEETNDELVYFKFDSMFDKEVFNPDVNLKLIGLDTEEPFVQLGAQVFTGKWEMATGTCTFFEEDPNHHPDDPIFNEPSKINVKYLCNTRKVLQMNRTILTRKSAEENPHRMLENEASLNTAGSPAAEENENEETASDSKDIEEIKCDLSVEDIKKISLEQSEIDPFIIDEIMET